MLPETLTLEVVTPERQLVEEEVHQVCLPGREGDLGILPGHAPLLTELGIGALSFRRGNQTHYLSIVYGFAEVLPDRVIVLAEVGERAEEIDLERARAARQRAEKLFASPGTPGIDWEGALNALQRARVRQEVATHGASLADVE